MGSLFNSNATYGNSDLFVHDGDDVHPNDIGHARLAKILFKWTLNNIVL